MYWKTYIYAKPVATSGIPIWFNAIIITCADDEQLSTHITNLINFSSLDMILKSIERGMIMKVIIMGGSINLYKEKYMAKKGREDYQY